MDGLIPIIIPVDDNVEIVAVSGCHRDKLLTGCGDHVVHQIHVALRCQRGQGFFVFIGLGRCRDCNQAHAEQCSQKQGKEFTLHLRFPP